MNSRYIFRKLFNFYIKFSIQRSLIIRLIKRLKILNRLTKINRIRTTLKINFPNSMKRKGENDFKRLHIYF